MRIDILVMVLLYILCVFLVIKISGFSSRKDTYEKSHDF